MSSTLIFKSIEIRNFLSYGNQTQTILLDEPGTCSIEGLNLDTGGGANGVGKSAIYNALCYALYNKPFDNISLQRLINATNATKNTLMEVKLVFEKDGSEYEIYRARGEEYRIEILRDGENITPGKGVNECDQLILDIIGISYDLFTKTVVFSGNSTAFLQMPVAQQRNQIEELFNITILSEKAQQLKENIRTTEQDIKVAEAVVQHQQVAIDLHAKHIKEAAERIAKWDAATLAEIAKIEKTLAQLDQVDFEAEKHLHDQRTRLKEDGSYLATRLAPLNKDRQFLSKEVEKLLKEQAHLEDAKCPYCAQAFADAPAKLQHIEKEIELKGSKLLEAEEEQQKLSNLQLDNNKQLLEIESQIKHPNFNSLLEARENIAALKTQLQTLQTAVNPHTEAHAKLVAETPPPVDQTNANTLRRRLDHQSFLLKLLTDKNSFLRRRIINQTIPFLNSRINFYTQSLGLPHVVKFDADMSCTVAEYGRELDFGNLSAGEKKRVNTSLALAFRDVMHHLHAKTNLLLIDELDGALDNSGIDCIVKVLKEKSRDEQMTIYVISHHPAIAGRLDRTIKIVKEQGFSRIDID